MQRIVFINLHANPFLLKNLKSFIWKQSCALKHKYFLDYLISNPNIEVCNYINEKGFTLICSFPKSIQRVLDKLRFWEHRITLKKNGIPLKAVKVLKSMEEIRQDDIVISYSSIPNTLFDLNEINAFKAISLIHFYGNKLESELLHKANPSLLFNESNLMKYSLIFNKYYDWYKGEFLVHNFVAADRFKVIIPFSERCCKCFSTGTITYRSHPEQLDVYGDTCIQPTRKQIASNKEKLSQYISCYNSDYLEDAVLKKYLPSDNFIVHLYKVWYNSTHGAQQKKYFSFNMVEKFNEHKMCIIGEEVLGIPGIGFVEGMSCGCAYIGQTLGYYEDYGMKEGVHYIGYDGSLDNLIKKISYYQDPAHNTELESIAEKGYEFAREHFSGTNAAKDLLDKLIAARNSWMKNQ